MENIVIVGIDKDFCITISKQLSKSIKFKFVNAEEKFQSLLISTAQESVFLIDDFLNQKETEILIEILKSKQSIIFVPNDMFLSNKNYKIFKDVKTILIEDDSLNEIMLKIQKRIKNYCKYSINKNNFSLENLLQIVKG